MELWLLIAANEVGVPEADDMLASLRRVIADQDCKADPVTPAWRLPLA